MAAGRFNFPYNQSILDSRKMILVARNMLSYISASTET